VIADPKAASTLFAALGDETRLRVLGRLSASGPASIRELSAVADVSRQAVTKHLDVLADAGLVRSYRSGRERISELEPDRLDEAERYLERISAQWDAALLRLKRLVEEG